LPINLSSVCITPSTPAAANITATSTDISWNSVAGASDYEYVVSTSGTIPATGASITGTTYNAINLLPATQYHIYVRSHCGGSSFSGWSTAVFTTLCPAPSIPSVNNITTTTADLSWSAVSGVGNYEYAVTTSVIPPASGTGIAGTVFNASGLTPGTQYYIHIRSDCGGGNFSAWATTGFNTQVPSCNAPGLPVITNITAATADISWGAVSGSAGYEYAVTASSTSPASGISITSTGVTPNNLLAGTPYYFHLRNNCGGSFSSWVNTSFTTLCPAIPTLVISNITSTSANISWTAVGGATGYQYFISTNATVPASGTPISGTFYNPAGLNPGTQYYVYARTVCSTGSFSNWVTGGFITLCAAPSQPIAINITSESAEISWDAVNGIVGYEYEVSTSQTPPVSGIPTTNTSYNVQGLTASTQYYIHVRSNCSQGVFSSWITTAFVTLCPSPTTPIIDNITGTSANINWNPVTGVISYEYELSTSSALPTDNGIPVSGVSVSVSGLSPGITYYIHLRSNCGIGFSSWMTISFNTNCYTVTNPIVSSISSSSAVISWVSVNGVPAYQYAVTTSTADPVSGSNTIIPTFTASTLLPGTKYYAHIRSRCGGSNSFSDWLTVPFITLCPSPTEITITNISSSADINWSAVNGATGYQYFVSTNSTPPISGVDTNATNYHIADLASYTTYYVHVRTKCSVNVFSSWVSKSFIAACFKPSPFIIANNPQTGTADIGWKSMHGAIKYEYAILSNMASPGGSMASTQDTVLHASGLKSGARYYLHVRTACSSASSSEWSILEFHTSGIAVLQNAGSSNRITITIYGEETQNGEIEIFDAVGKLIKKLRLNGNTINFDISSYAAGIYFIRYEKNAKYVTRMIKW
jgi:hypothetical protein